MKKVLLDNKPEKYKAKAMQCYVCTDAGYVVYQKEYNGTLYDTAARCICEKGKLINPNIESIDKIFNVIDIENDNRKIFNKPIEKVNPMPGFIEINEGEDAWKI